MSINYYANRVTLIKIIKQIRKNMLQKSLIILLFFFQNLLYAQTDKGLASIEMVQKTCQQVVQDFADDNITTAFERLDEFSSLPQDELLRMKQGTIEQLSSIYDRFGKPIGIKLIKEDLIQDVAYQLIYIVKLETHALRVRFIFYNGKSNKWYLTTFKWDDKISELFEK